MSIGHSKRGRWLYPLIGGIFGLLYVILDEGVLDHLSSESSWLIAVSHEFLDAVLPVLLGVSLGVGAYLLRRQKQLGDKLSLKNEALQNDLLLHTLISQMLHEIRNPVHTILAALENPDTLTAAEQKELIVRNLGRFNELRKVYEEKESLFDRVNAREPLRLDLWLPDLLEDKVHSRLKETGVAFSKKIGAAEVRVHPLLLEQVLLALFSNAVEAAAAAPPGERWIGLEAAAADRPDTVEIRLSNSGALFPREALDAQGGQPVKSAKGHGLGLLLAGKLLEQAGGSLRLENREGKAMVRIWMPGKPA